MRISISKLKRTPYGSPDGRFTCEPSSQDICDAIKKREFENRIFSKQPDQDSLKAEWHEAAQGDEREFYRLQKMYHARRIATLVSIGWDDPIEVAASLLITDGNHRLRAAEFRGDNEIHVQFKDIITQIRTLPKILLLTAVILQAATKAPIRLGEVGRKLADQDIAAVERIASTNGGKPWLLVGQQGQIIGFQIVQAYCTPAASTRDVRRGSLVYVSRQSADSGATWQPWALQGKGDYAQVAIPARDFDRINGDQDVNRPFRLSGKFTDDELASLAKFVRSSPAWDAAGKRTAIEGTWPFLSISRDPDGSIVVNLRRDDWSGQEVKIQRKGDSWVILSIGFWIV